MKTCAKCGSLITFRSKIELADAFICKKCFRSLGFDSSHDHFSTAYVYDEIKDGREEMIKRKEEAKKKKKRPLSEMTDEEKEALIQYLVKASAPRMSYGQERDVDCEPEEQEMFDAVQKMFVDAGKEPDELKLVRKSDNYVTAKYGLSDIARFHWGKKAKWIFFPTKEQFKDRHKVLFPEDVLQFGDLVKESVELIDKYE